MLIKRPRGEKLLLRGFRFQPPLALFTANLFVRTEDQGGRVEGLQRRYTRNKDKTDARFYAFRDQQDAGRAVDVE